ncbi:MAG: hypothetical protein ACXWJK_17790 [Burkholderiaceae bacterium]
MNTLDQLTLPYGRNLTYQLYASNNPAVLRRLNLELNAQTSRLDLTDVYCMMAKEEGALISINSDTHSLFNLFFLRVCYIAIDERPMQSHDRFVSVIGSRKCFDARHVRKAGAVAERLRLTIERDGGVEVNAELISVTVSIGLSSFSPTESGIEKAIGASPN